MFSYSYNYKLNLVGRNNIICLLIALYNKGYIEYSIFHLFMDWWMLAVGLFINIFHPYSSVW
jgi:hypothetical protein